MKINSIVRLAAILAGITVLGSAILGFSNLYTDPIIWERRMEELEKAMFDFFPEADQFEIEEIDDEVFYIVEQDDDVIGSATLATPAGYGGEIEMMVALDIDGKVRGIEVLGHSETPGLGDVIENPDWQEQFKELSVVDDIQIGVEVEVISGATVSSQGVATGVDEGSEKIARTYFSKDPREFEVIEVAPEVLKDGEFTGVGTGRNPGIKVAVAVENAEIVGLELVEHNESQEYMNEAWKKMKERITAANCPAVDTVSGATQSSVGIQEAVQDAIEERDEKIEDGVSIGEGTGRNPGVKVEVTVKDGEIIELDLLDQDDSDSYMEQAWEGMEERILDEQTADVDLVSGATQSSSGIQEAVEDALEQ